MSPSSRPTVPILVSGVPVAGVPSLSSGRPRMSSQCPRSRSKNLVSCGFCQSTSTTHLARTICGLLFVLRLLNSSTGETSSIRPSTLFVSAWLRRTRRMRRTRRTRMTRTTGISTSRSPRTGQSLPLSSQFGWGAYPILLPARPHSTPQTTSLISSRSTAFPTSMLRGQELNIITTNYSTGDQLRAPLLSVFNGSAGVEFVRHFRIQTSSPITEGRPYASQLNWV